MKFRNHLHEPPSNSNRQSTHRRFSGLSFKQHLYWSGTGILLARGLPLAAFSASWSFTAFFGRTRGGLLAAFMLCAFLSVLFLIHDDNKPAGGKGQTAALLGLTVLYITQSALHKSTLMEFNPGQPIPVATLLKLTADYILIAAAIWAVTPLTKGRWITGGAAAAVCIILPIILFHITPPWADRISATLSLLAAGSLIFRAAANLELAESKLSWQGLLSGIMAIMLIDIII